MIDREITLPSGDTILINEDRRSLQFYVGDLYKYRLVEQSQDVITRGGKYVPNVDDIVIDYDLGMFRVSYVDPTTYVANLNKWDLKDNTPEVSEEDRFLNSGTGYQSESWRIFLDTRTLPYHLEIDEGFRTYGNKSVYIKLFKGIDTSENGIIISAYYNQNGEYVSDRIPLEVVANVRDDVFSPHAVINNIAIKAPKIGYTTKDLNNGEYVTLVAYSQDGTPVRSARFLIHKTNIYRRVEDTQRRVTGIQLLTSYLSETESNRIYVPININVASIILIGRVSYEDGTYRDIPVGEEGTNSKFMIYGLKYWSPTVAGIPQKVHLVYQLSQSEEYSRMEGESESGLVKEAYQIVASELDPSMSLKLFAYPMWLNPTVGYALNYWLYDLARQEYHKVPANVVEFTETSRVFDGGDYSSAQTLTVGVRLGEVDSKWGTHRHVQTFQIALLRDGNLPATNWRVRHTTSQSRWFGEGKEALVSVGTGQLRVFDLTCGYTDLDVWLEEMYYIQNPLYDNLSESRAPRPTHFILDTGVNTYDIPVENWNNQFSVISNLLQGETVYLHFVRRDVNGELQLATTGIPTHNV